MRLFAILLDTFTIDWVATGARNVPIGIHFALFAANNVYKTFRRSNMLTCLFQYSIKLFLMPLPLFSISRWGN